MSDSYFPTDSLNAMNVETTVADAVSGENTSVKLGNLLNGYVVADENNQFRGLTDDSKNLSIMTGESLPDYSEANDGDALIIEDGEPTWGAVDALPEIEESDEGKVLAVDQGEAVWANAPSGLPEITAQDEGKVLTVVDNSGTLEAEWAETSGGDSIPVIHIIADDQGGYTHDGTFASLWAIGDGKPVKISVTGDFDFEYVGKTVQVASGTPSEPVQVKVSIGTSPLLFEYESATQVKASHDVIDILADNSVSWDTSESLYVDLSV